MRRAGHHQVHRLGHGTFDTFVNSQLYVLVRVKKAGGGAFNNHVLAYFANEYRADVSFGEVVLDDGPAGTWLMKRLPSSLLGQVKGMDRVLMELGTPAEGYYLFVRGTAVAYHCGTTKRSDDDGEALVAVTLSLLFWSPAPASSTVERRQQRHAKAVIAHFERAIQQEAQESSDQEQRQRSPYQILGVTPGASRDEIKKEHRRLVVQYHPDKVQHMGPELRELAAKKTTELNAALDEILKQSKSD